MPLTVLALTSLRPGNEAPLEHYLDVVGPLMAAAGARLLARHAVQETLAGSAPHVVSLVEYPDRAALGRVFDHPDYHALLSIREQAFARYDVCVLED